MAIYLYKCLGDIFLKVFAISDLHLSFSGDKPMDIFGKAWENYIDKIIENWNNLVSDEDIVLLAGDLSWAMTLENALIDIDFLKNLKGYKVIIRGNHDYWWKSISRIRENFPHKFYAVQNDCIRIEKYLICGTRGWTCPDGDNLTSDDKKIYLREAERLKLSFKQVERMRKQDDTIICMMHYPPFNTKHEPSDYTDIISQNNVDFVIYGHLHGKDCRADKIVKISGIPYYLTSCDLVENKLIRII